MRQGTDEDAREHESGARRRPRPAAGRRTLPARPQGSRGSRPTCSSSSTRWPTASRRREAHRRRPTLFRSASAKERRAVAEAPEVARAACAKPKPTVDSAYNSCRTGTASFAPTWMKFRSKSEMKATSPDEVADPEGDQRRSLLAPRGDAQNLLAGNGLLKRREGRSRRKPTLKTPKPEKRPRRARSRASTSTRCSPACSRATTASVLWKAGTR